MVFRAAGAASCSAGAFSQGAELEGVRLDDRVQVDGQALQLNGLALRTRYYFKVYVAGLYLPAKVTQRDAAIDGEGAKRIVLVMMRDATRRAVPRIRPDRAGRQPQRRRAGAHPPADRRVVRQDPRDRRSAAGDADRPRLRAFRPGTTLAVDGAAQGEPMPGRSSSGRCCASGSASARRSRISSFSSWESNHENAIRPCCCCLPSPSRRQRSRA